MATTRQSQSRLGLHIYSSTRELNELLRLLREKGGVSNQEMFARWVEQIYHSESLQARIRRFYEMHRPEWTDVGGAQVVRLTVSEQTRNMAASLAFSICGNGQQADLGRTLIRYYWKQSGITTALPAAALRRKPMAPPRKPRSPSEVRYTNIATSCTLDKASADLYLKLIAGLEMKSDTLLTHLAKKYALMSEEQVDVLLAPFEDEVLHGTGKIMRRFNFSKETDALLTFLSYRTLGKQNRSLITRALVRLEANEQGLTAAA